MNKCGSSRTKSSGGASLPVTVLIATVKSAVIALFFMHLIEEPASSWLALLVAVLLLATLLALALLDVTSRWLMLLSR